LQSNLSIDLVIGLLLHEFRRNFKSYGLIEYFIDDVLKNKYTGNDLVNYIQNGNNVEIILNKQEKDILMKLLRVNIEYRRGQALTLVEQKDFHLIEILFHLDKQLSRTISTTHKHLILILMVHFDYQSLNDTKSAFFFHLSN
jgi:hypothetical protein